MSVRTSTARSGQQFAVLGVGADPEPEDAVRGRAKLAWYSLSTWARSASRRPIEGGWGVRAAGTMTSTIRVIIRRLLVQGHFEGELGDLDVGRDLDGVVAVEAGAAELVLVNPDGAGHAGLAEIA